MAGLDRRGAVFVLTLGDDENRFHPDRLPPVDLGIPFTVGMNALIRSRLPIATAHEAMATARRYGGEDAREADIVAATAGEGDVLDVAIARAEVLDVAIARAEERAAKAGPVFGAIKARLYAEVITELTGR